jgi:hypothetical protein
MTRVEEYCRTLRSLQDWVPFLMRNSGLPGPRGNLELANAVAEEGNEKQFDHFLTYHAQENTPEVFVVFCGIVGLGKLAADQPGVFNRLREYASDSRWRIREAVATGLQLTGDQDMDVLLREMKLWAKGNWFEKRAAAAALAEPRLLKNPKHAKQVLQVLDKITKSMETNKNSRDDAFQVLRKAMGYCWSVAVVALPDFGKPLLERWLNSPDKDIRWVMRENLKKNRLAKMDAAWVESSLKRLA